MIGSNPHWFQAELARRLQEEVTDRAMSLGQRCAGDYADYSYGCGMIAGFEKALDISKEIMKELEQ